MTVSGVRHLRRPRDQQAHEHRYECDRKRAEQELRRRLVDIERDGYVHPEKITLAAFSERWLTKYLPGRGLKETTVSGYEQMLRKHLLPALGRYTLQELERKPELVDRYVTLKIQEGLLPKTVTNQLLCLQVILKRAVRWRLISRNPVSDCDRPRVAPTPDLAGAGSGGGPRVLPRDRGTWVGRQAGLRGSIFFLIRVHIAARKAQ